MIPSRLLPLVAAICSLCASSPIAGPSTPLQYDYIVVGSGAGGGPLACRLARAGHKTLLIESGDDQGENANVTVPAYQALVSSDPKQRWDMFVSHYTDQQRQMKDPKYVWETPAGDYLTQVFGEPPKGSSPKGILYPRAGTLGGCTTHNALIYILPHQSDWDKIATLTGDDSWNADNMNQYIAKVASWQNSEPTDPSILMEDPMLVQHLAGGAATVGQGPPVLNTVVGLTNALANNPNANVKIRDHSQGFYNIPLIMKQGQRTSVRDYIVETEAQYPLTVRMNCHVTKLVYDETANDPTVKGVEFLDGQHLYRASPLSGAAGTAGTAIASEEVILAGGAYNTPQILKLSGIGPANELIQLGITVVKDLPGVGTNMQDRYEIPVNVQHPNDFPILNGCTFNMEPEDKCYTQWKDNPYILHQRGAYATDGLAAAMIVRSNYAADQNVDLFIFGGPVNFIGYFPDWGSYAIKDHSHFSWYTLKAHTRNKAGTVRLKTTDPLDPPRIDFNYFDTGTTADGGDQKDLNAMIQAVKMSRQALQEYHKYSLLGGTTFEEQEPGQKAQSDEEIGEYIKDRAWGHHASCTCPIGPDGDKMAVLDSKFKVRGVKNLRVVDASVFPEIPGVFIQAPIFMIAEKAADSILNGD